VRDAFEKPGLAAQQNIWQFSNRRFMRKNFPCEKKNFLKEIDDLYPSVRQFGHG
jgi:hypothetical protein